MYLVRNRSEHHEMELIFSAYIRSGKYVGHGTYTWVTFIDCNIDTAPTGYVEIGPSILSCASDTMTPKNGVSATVTD